MSESQLEDARLENAVKEQFFNSLNDARAIRLLTQIDSELDLNANQMGAKYRWGYVPVDRRIPDRLGEWWRGLSSSEKRRHRLNWFRRYYMRLDVDRAAARLDLNDRLFQIQRKIEKEWYRRDIDLENVDFDFSSDTSGEEKKRIVEPAPKTSGDQEDKKEKTKRTAEEQPLDGADKETAGKDETRGKKEEKSDSPAKKKEPKSEKSIPDKKSKTASPGEEAGDTEAVEEKNIKTEEEDRSPFIYRRKGDKVEVIRRQENKSDTPIDRPEDSSEEDTKVEGDTDPLKLDITPPRFELEE
ncbi:MAG: hypothetical protein ACQEP7_02890 [bacterium]